jgi:hypothetical protein
MVIDEEAPTERPAGALGWAGLAHFFYWIDRKNGFGGFWATQILPFGDPVSFGGYIDFETALYNSLRQRSAAWRPETVRPPRRAAVDSVQREQSPFVRTYVECPPAEASPTPRGSRSQTATTLRVRFGACPKGPRRPVVGGAFPTNQHR